MWKFKATARMINRLIGVLLLILFTWLGLSAALVFGIQNFFYNLPLFIRKVG